MKNLSYSRLALALLVVGVCSVPARSADSARVGAYDFGYLFSGDARAKPVQVFDDGRNTYFQFRAGEAVPAIFAARSGAPQLVVPTQEGPYVRVPEVHGRFVLQYGRAQANVIHAGAERPDAPPVTAVAANGMTTPFTGQGAVGAGGTLVASLAPVQMSMGDEQALDRNSYATPVKGDKVYWPERSEQIEHSIGFVRGGYVLSRDAQRAVTAIAHRSAPSSRFTVIGRDDDSYKEGLERARADALREALVKAGISGDRITVRTGVAQAGHKGKLWDSTLLVDSQQQAPAMRTAPAAPAYAQGPAANPAVASNIDALVRSGVLDSSQGAALLARYQPVPPRPVAPPVIEVPEGGWTISAADKTVSGAVKRWARGLRYQVVWDAPPQMDAPIAGDARLEGQNLSEALDHLVRGLNEKGYALEVTIYANRVIRFTTPGASSPKSTGVTPPQAAPERREAAEKPAPEWQMLPGDRTVAGTLTRWAGDAHWRVVWAAKDQVPVTGSAVVKQPDFKSAAEFVMQQVAAGGYHLRATTRPDNILYVSSY